MVDVEIVELLTEGSKEERERAFKQKGEYLYRCVNSVGEEQRQCILLNEYLIKDDKMWLDEQGNPPLDLELACRYEKVLEERFYKVLLVIEKLDSKVAQLCHILQEKRYPKYQNEEEDSEEIRKAKEVFRVGKYNEFRREVRWKIIDEFANPGVDPSFIENNSETYFLRDNMLYNSRKNVAGCIKNVRNKVNAVIKSYIKLEELSEKKFEASEKESIKKKARQLACDFIFLQRDWDVELWMELIFLKFYKWIENNKPEIKWDAEQRKFDQGSLTERRDWISTETEKWFVEKGNKYSWQLTEKAVMELEELEDREKKLDLLNYIIHINLDMNSEINMIITHSDIGKSKLGLEFGVSEGARGVTKRLQQTAVKDMNPYIAALLWKTSNVSFGRLFQFNAIHVTHKDRKLINAYREVKKPRSLMGELALWIEEIEADPKKDEFWYIPKRKRWITQVCMEIAGPDKIKMTVHYLNLDTCVIELRYADAMERIANLPDDRMAEMLELSEFETKEALIRHCAEMVVRNYCKEYFGIPYERFQKIKCHANVTITIHPLVFYKPDGTILVGYCGEYMRNQMTWSGGNGYIEVYEEQNWQDREALAKDWEAVTGKMEADLKEKWIEDHAHKKFYSEYAMQMPDFFDIVYEEPYRIGESDAERIIQKICSESAISY